MKGSQNLKLKKKRWLYAPNLPETINKFEWQYNALHTLSKVSEKKILIKSEEYKYCLKKLENIWRRTG